MPGRDFSVRRHDLLVGKHGDHIGGEREALASLAAGGSDAAALLDKNWQAWCADGTIDTNRFSILASTPPFDHCNFTVLDRLPPERVAEWTGALFRMTYDNPAHRQMMDLERLTAWLPGRASGYTALTDAARELGFFETTEE